MITVRAKKLFQARQNLGRFYQINQHTAEALLRDIIGEEAFDRRSFVIDDHKCFVAYRMSEETAHKIDLLCSPHVHTVLKAHEARKSK